MSTRDPPTPGSIAAQSKFLMASVPVSARKLIARAFAGQLSPRQAIKAKCMDCSGYQRAEVADCRVILCPLHAVRPFQETRRKGSKNAPGSGISAKSRSRRTQIPIGPESIAKTINSEGTP